MSLTTTDFGLLWFELLTFKLNVPMMHKTKFEDLTSNLQVIENKMEAGSLTEVNEWQCPCGGSGLQDSQEGDSIQTV